jgi:hypothetical protein
MPAHASTDGMTEVRLPKASPGVTVESQCTRDRDFPAKHMRLRALEREKRARVGPAVFGQRGEASEMALKNLLLLR